MIKLGHSRDIEAVHHLPSEVVEEILDNLKVLDEEYGEDRNISEDQGGYVVILTKESDLKDLSSLIGGDIINEAIPEYVAIIRCATKEVFTVSLFICGSDFGIIAVIPYKITPKYLLSYA
ncbi:hypothetical protein [Proteiniclasticum ruminis]|uniref:Uncharacterized protein n=1 Tax=Proteiniclasticum ruminis TaxID=398199 RepID=A0A1G8TI13_9CLOT|nr:hypothetical protein [Proteiniclasticum ruminis]SDJ40300.1 hypothetical protein SAMN05421804_1198 [Proteiniclasticum ruminis]